MAGGGEGLGLAPTHALSMGYLGATLIAMITRVAAGHSGRPLAADDLAWALYWTLQAATLLRVGAALWPAGAVPLILLGRGGLGRRAPAGPGATAAGSGGRVPTGGRADPAESHRGRRGRPTRQGTRIPWSDGSCTSTFSFRSTAAR